jgi:hypothetical protein
MRSSFTKGDDFGVRSGVVTFNGPVGPAPYDDPVLDDNRAHGHFARGGRRLCKNKRFSHHFSGFGQRHPVLLAQ